MAPTPIAQLPKLPNYPTTQLPNSPNSLVGVRSRLPRGLAHLSDIRLPATVERRDRLDVELQTLDVVKQRRRVRNGRRDEGCASHRRRRERVGFRQDLLLRQVHDEHVAGVLVTGQQMQLDGPRPVGELAERLD